MFETSKEEGPKEKAASPGWSLMVSICEKV
jgi:hypothetical protein